MSPLPGGFTPRDVARNDLTEALGDTPLAPREARMVMHLFDASPDAMEALTALILGVRRDERGRSAPLTGRAGEAWLSSLRREAASSVWQARRENGSPGA